MADKIAHAHLRVRLLEADKAFLGALSCREGGKPNISRAVKQLIEKERSRCTTVEILPATRAKIQKLSKLLRRSDAQVINDAVDGILAMLEDDKLPLLVMELRLVRTYTKPLRRKRDTR